MPITLDEFYQEFREFVKLEAKRWEDNERRWEDNERRWVDNQKRWKQNEKSLNKIVHKFDELFDHLDKEVMADRKRIDTLEAEVDKITAQ